MAALDFLSSFALGMLTPLTAVCVLPLYPAFLAYLSNMIGPHRRIKPAYIGLVITAGVIAFMGLLGLVFTTLLKISLTKVISIISPIAFSLLGIISIFLILDLDISRYAPKMKVPMGENPYTGAFLFGFGFGAIVIPCNPGFIAAFFTKTLATSALGFSINMINFLMFGLGLSAPLLLFAVISQAASTHILDYLVKHKSIINRSAGIIMLGISLYYLIFVFHIFG